MRIHGKKYIDRHPIYTNFKKHYCPECNVRVNCVKVSKIVSSTSDEAKNFDFGNVDTYMVGNIKFIWKEFECPACKKRYSVQEMMKIEKKQ